jgi:HEAT repeat protein/PBS lyase HEAT-like repeat-containing protein
MTEPQDDKAAEIKETPTLLSAAESAKLIEFARACKAAARAVVLYPGGHPAIAATLGRIVHVTSPAMLTVPMRVTVHPDALLLEERALPRAEAAVTELAALLHSHLIGQLTIHSGGDSEAWRSFLLLLARSPESVRTDGGIARVWTTMAGRHIELREIDYAEVLRERTGGTTAVWDKVIANCLQGMAFDLDEEAIKELLGIAADSDRLADLMAAIEGGAESEGGGIAAKTAALLRMLRGIVDAVTNAQPEQLEPVLRNMATAVGQLSPEMLLGLIQQRDIDEGPKLMNAVVSRMTDGTIAQFVARNVANDSSATDRLAVAFQSLVQEEEQRPRLLALAKDDVAASPLGNTAGFETVWNQVAEKLLTSYSDKPYVSEEYAKELSGARTQAVEVEQVADDPPERISAWLGTVATTELRALDLTLLLDLLRIEEDDERWGTLMLPVVRLLEDLLLVGDFDTASQLVAVLVKEMTSGATQGRRQQAIVAIDVLIAGPMMRHVTTHLATVDEAHFERVKAMCVSLGEVIVRPLAEALSVEERPRTRERLTSILIAFGAAGRRTVERLKNSQNAAVRRTAILLMRQFGGSEALPDLTELLDDNEPQVQREAMRAILNIGTDEAYRILEQALASGTTRTREAIMQSLSMQRDERAVPLLAYIVRHVDHRGPLAPVYLRAIESLGALRDSDGVAPLKEALYKGEWWAPRRNALLRGAAAAALARVGTPEAIAVLDEAVARGTRGVRNAARAHIASTRERRRAPAGTDA